MMMRSSILAALCFGIAINSIAAAADSNCPIVPLPKKYAVNGTRIKLDNAAIVIGDKAAEPEKYAAERLQYYIEKRFGKRVDIIAESQSQDRTCIILLGQKHTNARLGKLIDKHKVPLDANTPGFDGYIVRVFKEGSATIICIGGSNDRGVTYGASSLFDLIVKNEASLQMPHVEISDWPAIKWRGRNCAKKVDEATYDAYVRGRINFVDTTYPMVGHGEKGFEVNASRVKTILSEAHKRGLFVFGVVNCAVKPDKFDQVLRAYDELFKLGVDGMWLSFDDAGEGVGAEILVAKALELAKSKGISGHHIVMTPPAGSYHNIETWWNRHMASQKGFDEIMWFFTRVPCECDLQTARKIGLDVSLPAWWHNWPRPASGLLNKAYGDSMYDKEPYFEVLPLEVGWHMPSYDELRNASIYTDMVVACAAGRAEYIMPVLGWWGWDPARQNWQAIRNAVYSDVFGPSQVAVAQRFDDDFSQLKNLFTRIRYKSITPDKWPPRLLDPATKPTAQRLVADMNALLAKLEAKSSATSLISSERLQSVYFDAMQDTVSFGKKLSSLDYPEYTLGNFSETMQELVAKNPKKAAERLNAVRPKVEAQLAAITAELSGMQGVDVYVQTWQEQISGVDYWTKMINDKTKRQKKERQRRDEMAQLFPKVVKGNFTDLLAAQSQPPKAKVLLTITPEQLADGAMGWKGDGWGIGVYKSGNKEALAIGFSGKADCNAADTAEVITKFIVPNYKGKLKMQIFVANYWLDKNQPPARGVRASVVVAGRKWLWVQDSSNTTKDNEWVTIDLVASDDGPVLPGETMTVGCVVHNYTAVKNFETVALFGPIRIIEE